MRVDLKGRPLSFTEIAKLVGENWQSLPPNEKEPYETQAFNMKEKYNAELIEYKKTENHGKYMEYLNEFKDKQAGVQHGMQFSTAPLTESIFMHNGILISLVATDASKRPKLEHRISSGSSGPGSSADSQLGADRLPELGRGESAGSAPDLRSSSGRRPSLPQRVANLPSINSNDGGGPADRGQGSPTGHHSGILPGYRDSMYATGQQQTLAWRDSRRGSNVSSSQYPSVRNMSDRRSGQTAASTMDAPHQSDMWLPGDRPAVTGFSPPPLLTSESTAGTTGSNSSSVHYMPRTPLEPPLPVLHPSKPYENQLPPLRSISLSPQSSIDVSYNSPSGKAPPQPIVFSVSFSYDHWERQQYQCDIINKFRRNFCHGFSLSTTSS
jgi:hypothetical protein